MTTLTAAELAERVQQQGLRLDGAVAQAFLVAWQKAGIAEERDGGWRLTEAGRAMFSGWDVNDPRAAE